MALVKASSFVLLSDTHVGDLYADVLLTGFQKLGAKIHFKAVPSGESSKCRAVKAEVVFVHSRTCTLVVFDC